MHAIAPARRDRVGRIRRTIARCAVAAVVGAAAAPLAAGPAAADQPSTVGRIVFDGGGTVFTMRSDGSNVVALTASGARSATWSPDGSRVAFVRGNDIWSVNADGSGERQLTTGANSAAPDWSPDGLSIAFMSARSGNSTQLYVMNADGTGESALTTSATTLSAEQPAWSPDGSVLAFRATLSGSGTGLFVMRPDGTGLTRLTTGQDGQPAWTPDGSAVFFSRLTGAVGDLFRISPSGTGLTQVTQTPASEFRPAVSPDGQHLLYDSASGTGVPLRLVVADLDGTDPVDLTDGTASRLDGEYSPAGVGGGTTPQPGTGSGSTSAGQTLDVAITAPAPGSEQQASSQPLTASGTVSLSAASTRPYNAAYVLDVSGSTGSLTNRDCDGSRTVNAADDLNGDGRWGDILDCEIAAVVALNGAVAGVPGAMAGVVALGGVVSGSQVPSVLADMAPDSGDQAATPAGAVAAGQARGHVETVLRSMRAGEVNQYTRKLVGENTDYDAALERMGAFFLGRPAQATNVAYFMSDGEPNPGTFDTSLDGPLQMAVYRGVRIFTFAVGTNAGGCGANQPLRVIADRTGGTCTAVSNPALLAAAVGTPATLDRVEARLDTGTPVTATLDATTTPPTWQATLPGGLPPGTHTLTVTARASDGSTVTATGTVTGLAAPVVDAGGPYTVDEGSTVALAGTATDADGDAPAVAWDAADGLSGTDTLTPTYSGTDDGEVTVTLTATDADGLTATDTATVTTVNVAPTLGTPALTPTPVTGSPFDLAVDLTDPGTLDSHTATIDWGDGVVEPATVTPADGGGTVTGSHTYAAGGDVTITVTVTDDDGGTATTQSGPFRVNTAPEVTAGGPYAVDEGTPLTLAGTASDADSDALTVAWSPADRIADPSSATSAYDTTDDAVDELTLTADDGDLSASAQTQVTVLNVAPELSDLTAPTDVVPPGQEVEITATWTDPGTADTHTLTVDWGDGTQDEIPVSGGALAARHTYSAGGTWTATITLTDDDGGSDTGTAAVVTNRAPVVDAGPDVVLDEGSSALLDATTSDPDGDALVHAWSPADAVLTPTVEDAEVGGSDDGSATLTLTATDPHGASASDTVVATVRNVSPSVSALTGPTGSPATGSTVRVTGTFTDPGALDTHTARADWGDGTSGVVAIAGGTLTAEHVYRAAGIYTVTITVTDDDGGSGSSSLSEVVVHGSGLVAAAGTFDSPAGAYRANPTATGRVTFAAGALYVPFIPTPVGVTSLQLSTAGFRFEAARNTWLVVSGTTATYQGTGTVNGRGEYAFTVTAVDGGRSGTDRIRIRIWDPRSGAVAYDNGGSATAPGTALRSGTVVVLG